MERTELLTQAINLTLGDLLLLVGLVVLCSVFVTVFAVFFRWRSDRRRTPRDW